MNKTTIVQILRSPEGGIRKHVVDILENLPADSYRKVFITSFADADRDLSYLKTNFEVEFVDLSIKDKPEIKDILNIFKIYKYLRSEGNLVLHGHGAKGGGYARICGFLLRCPTLYTPHGGSLHRVFGKVKSFIYDSIERVLIPFTNKFVFESQYSANEFEKYVSNCSNKKIINYNGVSFNEPCKTFQYQSGTLLKLASFGLLRHLKGHDIAIDALSMLAREGVNFSYTIFGHGTELLSLTGKINALNLQSRVKIETYTDNILKKMCEYDVIIHPSRFESFGYVPVEAMSVKVPVITSNEGGLKEVTVKDGTFLAKNNTPEEYASIIRNIYNGECDLDKMTEHAYEVAKAKFSIETMVKNLDSIYKSQCF